MEFLKELFNGGALTYEQLETAAKEKGFSVVNASGGAYVPKDQFDTLTSQLSAANKKLEGYDPEWKTKAETEQRKLEAMQFEFAVEKGVGAANPRNAKRQLYFSLMCKKFHVQIDKICHPNKNSTDR